MAANPAPDQAGNGPASFVVLADCADGSAVAAHFCGLTHTLRHASGRPWLIGRWADEEIAVGTAGSARIAIIGRSGIGSAELAGVAARLRDLADLDGLARRLPGSFHLVAALGDRMRVQGNASGLRLVFHATLNGTVVSADRADLLAEALGTTPDERKLAVRLLWPVPHPLSEEPVWHRVTAVSPGDALMVDPEGRGARPTRWWEPPSPTVPLADAAPRVREALTTAVRTHVSAKQVVSCDFSGGFDSTSVCFLAARSCSQVIANTWPGRDPGDDDLWWAEHAASYLPGLEHVVWPAEQAPLVYTGLLDVDDQLDEPTIGVMDRERVLKHLPGLVSRGSRLHLTGIGGDHVAWCSEAYYHRLLRRRPLFALRQLRGFRALWNWPLGPMAQALADTRSYGRWLADCAERLQRPIDPAVTVALGWGMAPRAFDWMTPQTMRMAREALNHAARYARPLADDRGMHADLEQIRVCTRILRQWDQMATRAGLSMAAPFLDDRVIEACLSVDPRERVTPWRYKPLLVEAMRGVVPETCLARTSKAQAVLDGSSGLRENRVDLLTMWEDSKLAELGLVDAEKLKALACRPETPELRNAILYSTIAVEVWLRTLTRKSVPEGA